MRDISVNLIRSVVKELFADCNISLETNEKQLLLDAKNKETDQTDKPVEQAKKPAEQADKPAEPAEKQAESEKKEEVKE